LLLYGLVGLPLPDVPAGLLVPLRFEPLLLLLFVPFVGGEVVTGDTVVDVVVDGAVVVVVVVLDGCVIVDGLRAVVVRGCAVVLVRCCVVVLLVFCFTLFPCVCVLVVLVCLSVRVVLVVCADAIPNASIAPSVKNDFFITYSF
jgi:hypothetical protein